MKKHIRFICFAIVVFSQTIFSQNVGINPAGTTPNTSAILDLNTGNNFASPNGKGLIVPNVSLTSTTDAVTVNTPFTSLLVYNTATASAGATAVSPGYYYWDGGKWVGFGGNGGKDWSLTGNAGTTVGTNFLGTTDNVDLQFNVNNVRSGLIDIANTQTFFGYSAGVNSVAAGNLTSFFGYNAGLTNSSGAGNTAMGFSALKNNATANDNTMMGVDAGYYLTGGYNTSVGMWSLEGSAVPANNTGVANTALGFCAGGGYNGALYTGANNNYLQVTSGSYNTFLGYSTAMAAGTYSNTTTVGAFAEAGANDVLILGGVAGTNGCTTSPKVGIGTINPSYPLHVYNSANAAEFSVIDNPNAGASAIAGMVGSTNAGFAGFQITSNAGGGWAQFGTTTSGGMYYDLGGAAGDHIWRTGPTYIEKMRLTHAGLLGVGTNAPNSNLHVNGAYQGKTKTVTVASTLANDDWFVLVNNNTGATFALTLPTLVAGTTDGKILYIRCAASANSVTITPAAGNALSTLTSWTNNMVNGEGITLISSGTTWYVVTGD